MNAIASAAGELRTLDEQKNRLRLSARRSRLRERNRTSGSRSRGHQGRQRLISLSVPATGIEVAAFLAQAAGEARWFWAEPDQPSNGAPILAGSGVAAEFFAPPVLPDDAGKPVLSRFDHIERQIRQLFSKSQHIVAGIRGNKSTDRPFFRPRVFGGFAFQDDFAPDNTWSVFYPAHFILPHYQFSRRGEERWLTLNALVNRDDDETIVIDELRQALDLRLALLKQTAGFRLETFTGDRPDLRYPMPYEVWQKIVEAARGEMARGGLDKVVLARVGEVRLSRDIDPLAALSHVERRYSDCYRFLFEPQRGHAFFGATPELLVQVEGDCVRAMALAGSIGRGNEPPEDDALADRLLNSAKDRHEHRLVVEAIHRRLSGAVEDVRFDATPRVLRLNNIQHLLTPFTGSPTSDGQALRLVELLHPTPALGGAPADQALAFIRAVEPVPRGWYGAPVGWIDQHGDGSFVVAIRSAVCQFERAWLYAGAGIVADSNPLREWQETELKFRPMLEALGVGENGL